MLKINCVLMFVVNNYFLIDTFILVEYCIMNYTITFLLFKKSVKCCMTPQ